MKETTIRIEVQKAARRRGIRNALHLAKRTGMSTNTTYPLWEGTTTRIDLLTLAQLCDLFQCGVQTLLVKTTVDVSERRSARPERRPMRDRIKPRRRVIQL